MPKKKHSPERTKDAEKSKGNLGQREADLQKSGKERLSHMEADETDRAGQNARPDSRGGQQRQRGRAVKICLTPLSSAALPGGSIMLHKHQLANHTCNYCQPAGLKPPSARVRQSLPFRLQVSVWSLQLPPAFLHPGWSIGVSDTGPEAADLE